MQNVLNMKMKLWKNQKGLTLIELLAVIVILGVIAAIAVPAIGNIIAKSKADADAQSVKIIQDATMWYLNDGNVTNTATESVNVTAVVNAGFLKEQPESQVTPGKKFATVEVEYDADTGWSVGAVEIES